ALRGGRAARGRSLAGRGRIAVAGRGPTLGPTRHEDVRRAGVVGTIAELGDVAHAGRARADRRALGVGRTGGVHAVAGIREVAGAGARPAHGSLRRRQGVGGTVVVHAVAGLGAVAVTTRRPAHGGALRVGRARATRPGAGLDDVADARRRPADGGGGLEGARRRAAVAGDRVPVVALLAGVDAAVPAGRPMGGEDRGPVACHAERRVGDVLAGGVHDPVLAVDRDVAGRATSKGPGPGERQVTGPRGEGVGIGRRP